MRAVLDVMGWPDDRDAPNGGEVPPGVHWDLATDVVRAVLAAGGPFTDRGHG